MSHTPIRQVVEFKYQHFWRMEGISWLAWGEEPVAKTLILDDKCRAKRATEYGAREKEAKCGVAV